MHSIREVGGTEDIPNAIKLFDVRYNVSSALTPFFSSYTDSFYIQAFFLKFAELDAKITVDQLNLEDVCIVWNF